jgi:Sulfotransferase domain
VSRGGGPDFVVIGVQKAGTSSLYRYLSAHPEVAMASRTELEFFSWDSEYGRGIDHYLGYFPVRERARTVGEVSPGFMRAPLAAERLFDAFPDARLIAILREPAERAFSAWKMQISKGSERRSFPAAVRAEDHYLDFGRYGSQLERVLESFGRDRLFIGFFEDLVSSPEGLYADLCSFLGVGAFTPPEEIRENPGGMPKHGAVTWALRSAFALRNTARRLGLGALVDHPSIDRSARVLRNRVAEWNRAVATPGPEMDEGAARWIRERLESEIDTVERLSGRKLTHWRAHG